MLDGWRAVRRWGKSGLSLFVRLRASGCAWSDVQFGKIMQGVLFWKEKFYHINAACRHMCICVYICAYVYTYVHMSINGIDEFTSCPMLCFLATLRHFQLPPFKMPRLPVGRDASQLKRHSWSVTLEASQYSASQLWLHWNPVSMEPKGQVRRRRSWHRATVLSPTTPSFLAHKFRVRPMDDQGDRIGRSSAYRAEVYSGKCFLRKIRN
jgi:hypothetical protein